MDPIEAAAASGDAISGLASHFMLDMATYAADLGAVHRGNTSAPAVYRDPRAFFEQTYLTKELRRLLQDALAAEFVAAVEKKAGGL